MNNRYQYDRIEAYINKTLSDHEMAAFEQDIKSDNALLEAYKIQLLEHEAMENMIAKDLKSKMAQWKNEAPSNPFEQDDETIQANKDVASNVLPIRRFNYGIAAGLISLIAALGYWFYIQPNNEISNTPIIVSNDSIQINKDTLISSPITQEKTNTHEIQNKDAINDVNTNLNPKSNNRAEFTPVPSDTKEYAYHERIAKTIDEAYEVPDELFSSLKSDDAPTNSPYHKALTALYTKEYVQALAALRTLKSNDQSNVRYLRGHIYFGMKKYSDAEKEFEVITKDEMNPNYNEGRWYRFLSVAAQLPKSKIKYETLLEQLASDENFDYRDEVLLLKTKFK